MSTIQHIRESFEGVIGYYAENPDKAISQDKEAIAIIEEGLRARATAPNGYTLISDMPKGIGGGASAPSPGWAMRAALANCEAIMISMRAAQVGVELKTLEVRVDSVSDDRGLLGVDDSIYPGPLNMKVGVRIGAEGVPPEKLREIVEWSEKFSPVGDALRRAMPMEVAVEVVG